MQSPGFLVETAASWAPCTSRGRCEASRSPRPARSHRQAAPNLAGAGSPRPGRARRPCASLPLLRPRAPGHAAPRAQCSPGFHAAPGPRTGTPASSAPTPRCSPPAGARRALRSGLFPAQPAARAFWPRPGFSASSLCRPAGGPMEPAAFSVPTPSSPPSRSPSHAQALEWRRGQRPTNRYTVYLSH